MKPLKQLFSPIQIAGMELRNRIVMAPMGTLLSGDDGVVSQRLIDYYEARARGGVGLITFEVATVDQKFPYTPNGAGLWDDGQIPAFKKLTDVVHSHGAKIQPQIIHPGPESLSFLFTATQPVGPSALMSLSTKQICRELSVDEIENIVDQFGEAARRAREAGCDSIEFHCAHAYLLAGSFLSPLRNRRTDAYGGSLEGRLKFPLDVIRCMKERAGSDFPISVRISGDEYAPGGRNLEDTQLIAPIFVDAGVNAFHVSAGSFPLANWRVIPPTGTPPGINRKLSAAIKQVVDVPVMVVGRINDPLVAEDILEKGDADMVVLGRALLADPELPNKAKQGRLEDITPCIGCSQGCLGRIMTGQSLSCVINPTVTREKEMTITPAAEPRRVLVAGGGPGGLEAARVAALRGHQVTLCEKDIKLGGQFNLACVAPMKQELCKVIKYLSTQVQKAGVEVRLSTEVTPQLVEELKPDAVIVATGGVPLIPDVPGIRGDNVVSAHDVLASVVGVQNVEVLVIGGGLVGLEVADLLANPGDNPLVGHTGVTVVEMLDNVGMDIAAEARTVLMARLRENGVEIVTSTRVVEILPDGVRVVNTIKEIRPDWTTVIKNGDEERTIGGIGKIILAVGVQSVDDLSAKIGDQVAEVHVIGDAKQPRKALEAIAEGAEVGRAI
jgi:NAD(H)-dependent 7beta-hydroxy-3-oxo-delta4-cholenoic acid oxidoreductase